MASGIVEPSSQESQDNNGQGIETANAPAPTRSKLVQRLLAATANLPQFIHDLLNTQAVVVAGTEAAGFLVEKREQELTLRPVAHIRPDNSDAATRQAAISAFREIIRPCLAQAKDGAIEISGTEQHAEPQYCLVTLLRNEGEIVAASAVITRCRNLERAQQRLMSMQLVAGYFDLYTLRRSSEQSQIVAQSHQHVLQLATSVATATGFVGAATSLCNELATRTGASRVTLGWLKHREIRVKAVSHTEEFDKKQELIILLERVMEEAVDQEEPVQFDTATGGSTHVSRMAEQLSRLHGAKTVLTLPLRRQDEIVGAIVLEFTGDHKLGPQGANGLAVAVDLLTPQLYDRYQNDRWLITKVGLSIRDNAELVMGPQHMIAKMVTTLCIAVAIAISIIRIPYNVSAHFSFDPVAKATVDSPFDAQLDSVPDDIKPGKAVYKGEVLATMNVNELIPKLNEATAQAEGLRLEAIKDEADPTKTSDAAIAMKQRDIYLAQARQYSTQIDEATIRSPIDGVILKGDLQDRKNDPFKQGDEMFVIAPLNDLRAKLEVKDQDIQQVRVDQTGQLATTSRPMDKYNFKVTRVVPLDEAKEGENIYTVYGTIQDPIPDTWRPGMEGEASIYIGRARIVWVWTHKAINFVRLKMWTIF